MTQNLEELRKEINNVDDNIIELLAKRKNIIKEIALIKKELNKPIFDKNREDELIERLKVKSRENGLDENFVASLYNIF